jgi:hypothetical protein
MFSEDCYALNSAYNQSITAKYCLYNHLCYPLLPSLLPRDKGMFFSLCLYITNVFAFLFEVYFCDL